MSSTDPAATSEERKKKSVYYQSCTSDFKDDFATLVTCLKLEKGAPHTRQEAGFLLWHHALEGDDVPGLLSAGLLPACLANLDAGDELPTEKACSAGILLALTAGREEVSEQLLRSRAPSGRSSLEVLHAHLWDDTATATRNNCCRLLHLMAKQVGPVMLKCMDNQTEYLSRYLTVLGDRDAAVVTGVAWTMAALMHECPGLATSIVSVGGVAALLGLIRNHKAEAACCAAVSCLARLLTVEAAADQLIAAGGIPVLIDLIGPPPRLTADLANLTLERLVRKDSKTVQQSSPRPTAPSAEGSAVPSSYDSDTAATPTGVGSGSGSESGGRVGGGRARFRIRGAQPSSNRGSAGGDSTSGASPGSRKAPASSGSEAEGPEGGRPQGASLSRSVSYAPPVQEGKAGGLDSPVQSPRSLLRGKSGGAAGRAASSHSSFNSHGRASPRVRVQLPLIIPRIHSPSAAAAAAALNGVPSPRGSPLGLFGEASTTSLKGTAVGAAEGATEIATTPSAPASPEGGAAANLPPLVLPAADLGTNRCALRWILLPGLEVASLAVLCLTLMINRAEVLLEAERRLAVHRIVAQLKAALPAAKGAAEGSGKKASGGGPKKKRGLGLTAEQTAGLARLMALLKFLSLMNTNRYRIAKLGAIPALVRLYGEGADYLLRTHCQDILSNVALLAENGQELRDAGTPEEFLVGNPMRLTTQERAVLGLEFPQEAALVS